jgi:hypothetical protein
MLSLPYCQFTAVWFVLSPEANKRIITKRLLNSKNTRRTGWIFLTYVDLNAENKVLSALAEKFFIAARAEKRDLTGV